MDKELEEVGIKVSIMRDLEYANRSGVNKDGSGVSKGPRSEPTENDPG